VIAAAPELTPEEAAKKEAKRLAKLKEKEEKRAKLEAKVHAAGAHGVHADALGCDGRRRRRNVASYLHQDCR
jgi:hypothetical protein